MSGHGSPFALHLAKVLASVTLFSERLLVLLAPVLCAAGIHVAFALLGLYRTLPAWLHLVIVFTLGSWAISMTVRTLLRWRWPKQRDILRRIEQASGLAHAPLQQLEDRQVTNLVDPTSVALWRAHGERILKSLGTLRAGWPDLSLSRIDPWGIRIVVAVGLIIAFSQRDIPWQYLEQSFWPRYDGVTADIHAELWIAPPAYTRATPVHLDSRTPTESVITLPEGSKLVAQVVGYGGAVHLFANGADMVMPTLEGDTRHATLTLRSGETISVGAGAHRVAQWHIAIQSDNPPSVAFAGNPATTERGVLRIPYHAQDDYGVTKLTLVLTQNGQSARFSVTLPAGTNRNVQNSFYQDLTAHPWAGLEVGGRLEAEDSAGHRSVSEERRFTLPERLFTHPAAKVIIAARKSLVRDPDNSKKVANALLGLDARPDLLDNNISVFLALNFAWRRLLSPDHQANQAQILQLLWDTAVALEDGGTGSLLAELRKLQRQLQEALARNAPQEEIDRLMNQLQQAMNEYMRALAQQAEQAMRQGHQPTLTRPGLSITQSDLNRLLNDAARMAQSGAKNAAQQMLDRLQNILENLQAGIPSYARDGSQQMLQSLTQTMMRQQQLTEKTFEAQRNNSGPGSGAQQQQEIRQGLGAQMRELGNQLGDLPEGVGNAEQAMREAEKALQEGDLESAGDAQNRALQNLQRGVQALAKQLQRRGGQPVREHGEFDPLGRPLLKQDGEGATDASETKIPGWNPLEESRRVFQQLLERRNDATRPKTEQEYLDRLLRQF
ncbi:MAG TPA: DUF4175 family protein [Dongiaceae bacterium]|jgi:uncharacterized protein (TIGR02302 family)|nr:DUF4175 family protein [Dongiaceae bacterium]